MKRFPVALQPFTVREELAADYLGTLEKVAGIGYRGIELGPPKQMTTAELKRHLDRLGLQVIGCHAGLEQLTRQLDEVAGYLREVGGQYVILSHRFESRQEVLEAAQTFNRIGENCRKLGLQFLYHNHDWEFRTFEGEYVLDILLGATDPDLVKMELDTYWVKRGGEDPAAYLRKLKGRCPLLHIKDMEPGKERFFAEIGEGILDFVEIAQAAAEAGTEWLVVEQDLCRRPPLESAAISYRNLKRMGLIEPGDR